MVRALAKAKRIGGIGMKNIKSIKFKGFDLRIPFLSLKFEKATNSQIAGESGKANNKSEVLSA